MVLGGSGGHLPMRDVDQHGQRASCNWAGCCIAKKPSTMRYRHENETAKQQTKGNKLGSYAKLLI